LWWDFADPSRQNDHCNRTIINSAKAYPIAKNFQTAFSKYERLAVTCSGIGNEFEKFLSSQPAPSMEAALTEVK
jgi:hypothetical protein